MAPPLRAPHDLLPRHPENSSEPPADELDLLDLEAELKRLAAVNEELIGPTQELDLEAELRRLAAVNEELIGSTQEAVAANTEEMDALRRVNDALRARLEELEQQVQVAAEAAAPWEDRQREYEALLEEKSEVIRELHLRLHELQEAARAEPAARAATRDGPPPDADELYRLKDELEEERRRLSEDEDALMVQMRQMEMAMARDRAELARQRQELQRLHAGLAHEIEMAGRDSGLRERLQQLRRTQDERPGTVPSAAPASGVERKSSGLLRRLFG